MDLRPVTSVVAIVAALAIAPVLGSDLVTLERRQDVQVVEDTEGYAGVFVDTPRLCLTGGSTDDAIHVTHNYTADSDLHLNGSALTDKFQLANPLATLSQGETHVFELEVDDALNDAGNFTFRVEVDIWPQDAGRDEGFWTLQRDVKAKVVIC